jgi:hypothetical protein
LLGITASRTICACTAAVEEQVIVQLAVRIAVLSTVQELPLATASAAGAEVTATPSPVAPPRTA